MTLATACILGAIGMVALWPRSQGDSSATAANVITPEIAHFFGPALVAQRGGSFGMDHLSVRTSDDPRFQHYLRVSYPMMSSSPHAAAEGDGVSVGGAQLYLENTAGPMDHAYLQYYVRFPTGFDWVKGGKLPGLYGGTMTSGGKIPDGSDGLSTRYMWRRGGAGEVYAYLPTSITHGTSLGRGDWSWPTGRWTCVQQEVALNDPGVANGSVDVSLDGRQVLQSSGITFRTVGSLRIQGLFFSTFFGGGDKSWATPTPQSADFAQFRISTHPLSCR